MNMAVNYNINRISEQRRMFSLRSQMAVQGNLLSFLL